MTGFIAIGVGCRTGVSGEALAALVRRALESVSPCPQAGEGWWAHIPPPALRAPFSRRREKGGCCASSPWPKKLPSRGSSRPLGSSARRWSACPREALTNEAPRILTRSAAAEARYGVPNVAEAAALAGAGPGGKLLGPRLASDGATCAVALPEEAT